MKLYFILFTIFFTTSLFASIKSVCRGKFSNAVSGLTSSNLHTICATNTKSVSSRAKLVILEQKKMLDQPAIIKKGACSASYPNASMNRNIQGIVINVCSQNLSLSGLSDSSEACKNNFLQNVHNLSNSEAKDVCEKDPLLPSLTGLPYEAYTVITVTVQRRDMMAYSLFSLARAISIRDMHSPATIYANIPCPAGSEHIPWLSMPGPPQPMTRDGSSEILHVCKITDTEVNEEGIQDAYADVQLATLQSTGVILPPGVAGTLALSYLASPAVLFKVLTPIIGLKTAEAIAFNSAAVGALSITSLAFAAIGLTVEAVLINRIIQLGKTRKVLNQALSKEFGKQFNKSHKKANKKLGCFFKNRKKKALCEKINNESTLILPGHAPNSSKLSVTEFLTKDNFANYIIEITSNRSILNIKRKRNGKEKVLTIRGIIRKIKKSKKSRTD
jgi:hypothetical protein